MAWDGRPPGWGCDCSCNGNGNGGNGNGNGGNIPSQTLTIGASGAPPFENGWENMPGVQGATAYKYGPLVVLQGFIHGGTLNTTFFTLPAGWRPPGVILNMGVFPGEETSGPSAGTDHTHNISYIGGQMGVMPSGEVMQSAALSNFGQSLSGFTFWVGT